jgi:hypothetical protein
MWRFYAGAIMVIVGIAGFIAAHSHHPEASTRGLHLSTHEAILGRILLTSPASGWSQTAYDLVLIAAWALVILGALAVIVGLIGLWGDTRSRSEPS